MAVSVLIVEDDPDMLDCLEWVFTTGFDLHVASNGVEAIELLGAEPVDVLVLDLSMAPLDGYDVLRFIEENEIGCRALLASAQPGLQEIARQVRADAFLTKPYDLEALKQEVIRLAALGPKGTA
jgi:CheY-like chemotaxis protein